MIRLFIYFVELRWRRAAALQPAAARDIGHYIYCSPASAGTWHDMTWHDMTWHDMTCSQSPSCWYHYNSCVSRCWQCQDVRMFVRRKRNTKSCRWTFWKRTHIDRRTIFGACTVLFHMKYLNWMDWTQGLKDTAFLTFVQCRSSSVV